MSDRGKGGLESSPLDRRDAEVAPFLDSDEPTIANGSAWRKTRRTWLESIEGTHAALTALTTKWYPHSRGLEACAS